MPRPSRRQRRARPDGPEADEPGGPARQLPGPEALVGDGPVLVDLAGADVGVRSEHATCGREEQCHPDLGHGVGVASRSPQHRDPGGRGRVDVDVVGVTAGARHRHQGEVEDGPGAAVGFDHEDGGAFGRGPLRQLFGVVDAKGLVVDPRVDDEVGELTQQLDPGPPNGGGHERPRAGPIHRSSLGRRTHS